MKWLPIMIFFLLTGCAHSDPWTKRDTIMQVAVTGTYAIDAMQTSRIQYRSDLQEVGPIARGVLGAQPSTSDTWQYFATVSATSYLIARALPARWRPFWQGGQLVVEGRTIFKNCENGLGKICGGE